MVLETPVQWPKEVSTYYEPVRVLGQGGFGSVILGRRLAQAQPESEGNDDKDYNDRRLEELFFANIHSGTRLVVLLHSKTSKRKQYRDDWLLNNDHERERLVQKLDEILLEVPP